MDIRDLMFTLDSDGPKRDPHSRNSDRHGMRSLYYVALEIQASCSVKYSDAEGRRATYYSVLLTVFVSTLKPRSSPQNAM